MFVSLFKLAYRKIEPLGATPGEVSLMIDLLADDLGVPSDPMTVVSVTEAAKAYAPGSKAGQWLTAFQARE